MNELYQSAKESPELQLETPLPLSVEKVMRVADDISKLRCVAIPNQEVPES